MPDESLLLLDQCYLGYGRGIMQAFVITAYKNQGLLKKNLEVFSKYFKCFVHIDKKSSLNNKQFLDELNHMENVTAVSKYKINWGSYLHMMAILDLLKLVQNDSTITRVHIMSGEDFPVKSIREFYQFFEVENRYKNFMELTDITDIPVMHLRYEKFHFLHIFNRKSKNYLIKFLDKGIRQLQYHLPVKRKISFRYKGLVWSSISIEAVDQIIKYLTPNLIRELKYCEIAEEFMVQNALMESELRDTVVADNLRYANWAGCLTGPNILGIEEYEKIKDSNAFFARKIEYGEYVSESACELYNKLFSCLK